MHSTIIQVHKLSSYLKKKKKIIPVIFIDAFPLLFAIFHNFFFVDLPLFTDFVIFFTIFHYFLSLTLLTDFPLFFVDFPLLTDFPLFFTVFH